MISNGDAVCDSFNPLLQALMRTLVRGNFDRIVVCVTGKSFLIWHELLLKPPNGHPARQSVKPVGILPYVDSKGIAFLQVHRLSLLCPPPDMGCGVLHFFPQLQFLLEHWFKVHEMPLAPGYDTFLWVRAKVTANLTCACSREFLRAALHCFPLVQR